MKLLNKIMCVLGYVSVVFIVSQIVVLMLFSRTASKRMPKEHCVDTKNKIDFLVAREPALQDFADSVRDFYLAIQKKDWRRTYEFRTSDFKKDVKEGYYLREMAQSGNSWSLDSYEVLEISRYDSNSIRLIMRFEENGMESCNVVWWVKENGVWHCREAGPQIPPLFKSTRMPLVL